MGQTVESSVEFNIHSELDVLRARQKAVEISRSMKFSDIAQAEIEIAVSELGLNIIKHANSNGVLSINCLGKKERSSDLKEQIDFSSNFDRLEAIEIVARNHEPCVDLDTLAKSGLMSEGGGSTTGTLGIGISGVKRLMDEFMVKSDSKGCLVVSARKWITNASQIISNEWRRANCSVMVKPCPGETLSGDAYYIRHLDKQLIFAVIDALGHGPEANVVAKTAVSTMDLYHREPLDAIMRHCHIALTNSRGAAISLGLVDYRAKKLIHVSIGNVETRIYNSDKAVKPMLYNGTVGVMLPHFRIASYNFARGMVIVSYSDGISDKFELDANLRRSTPQEITQHIINNFSRVHDDSTVLVIK
ncbi:MAG: SpoIIE family protein phosphatase [Desulfamplus sp.]|nr:SpoIIE family protein phosphatase [Desulfamplus sp.]MBF0390378.1 SpoIIE family protein phosphatase [Desulfamplus sp.]